MNDSPSYLVSQLNRSSAPYEDPYRKIDWALLDPGEAWLPREAVSLAGLDAFERLDEDRKRVLSQHEFLNFIEAGIWLEAMFMERMARVLRSRRADLSELKYRAHEIREESGHTLMFLELVERSGLSLSATQWAPPLLDLFTRTIPVESVEFWLAAVLGEEIPDQMNRYIRRHGSGVNAVILQLCGIHMKDEARHIAYARELVRTKAAAISNIRRRAGSAMMNHLLRQFVNTFYYPSPAIYERAGLTPGRHWHQAARANPHRQQFLRDLIDPGLRLLRPIGYELRLP